MMDERFWARVRTGDGCWEWQGSRSPLGYGRVQRRGVSTVPMTAHRYVWQMVKGDIPDGLFVLHKCDNPPCVRPSHLYVGSALDNSRDMLARARHFSPFSYRNFQAKISAEDVLVIRTRALRGEQPIDIAKDYPIGRGQVAAIIRGESWAEAA